ncbi:MAG: 2-amino-4-hydroxy-6-hydroxymethyldihydropteridine diphosphokinase [Vicinamibacterales bacterium]
MAAVDTFVAVALGSNLGDRAAHLTVAVERLSLLLHDLRVSRFYETQPWGVGDQPNFLNAALAGTTSLTAHSLLDVLQRIERDCGRERPFPNSPRTLDLDIILFGNEVIGTDRLQVPHPRFRERRFVLEPLHDVAPLARDPQTGLTVRALWEALQCELAGAVGMPSEVPTRRRKPARPSSNSV